MTTERLHQPSGETVEIVTRGRDCDGAHFEVEGTLPPHSGGPPAHRHRRQSETFTVLEGTLRVRVGRERRDLGVGESLVIPPGTTHAFANPAGAPTRFRARETPADQLEEQLRLLAGSGRFPPVLGLARINVAWDLTFELAGLPGVLQRPLWRALAALHR